MEEINYIESNLEWDREPFIFSEPQRQLVSTILSAEKPIVIVKSRQVGMTLTMAALEIALSVKRYKFNSIHVLPTMGLAHNCARNKHENLILDANRGEARRRNGTPKSCVEELIKWGSHCNRLTRKEFKNNSCLIIESSGINGDRLRGLGGDLIVLDEAQCMTPMSINVCCYIKNHNGKVVYLITPKNDILKNYWKNSQRNYFNLKCSSCSYYFPMYISKIDDDYDWKEIYINKSTVKCPKCKEEQDKSEAINNGKWICNNNDGDYIGFHINQLLVDSITRENIEEPKESWGEKYFYNEVLGDWLSRTI